MDNNSHNVVFDTDDRDSSLGENPTSHPGPTSINRQSPLTLEAQQELVDMLMTVEDDDDMPSLAEVSSTESDVENIASNSNDIQIPTQQAQRINASTPASSTSVSSSPLPSSSTSTASQPHRGNRRARVEDDDDDDRDRRHPSQRVGDQSNATSDPLFVPFFTSLRDFGAVLGAEYLSRMPNPNPSGNGSTPHMNPTNNNTNPTPAGPGTSSQSQGQPQNPSGPTNRPPPMHFVDYEFSIVMDGSGRTQPIQRPQHQPPPSNAQDQPDGNAPAGTPSGPTPLGATGVPPNISFNPPIPFGNLATLLGIPFPLPGGGFGFPLPEEKEDPERARKLVDGLEEVPVGLVRRLERVGTGGGGMGEDETKGGDVGCAICWDRLLPEKVVGDRWEEPTETQGGGEDMVVDNDSGDEETAESKYAKVVSLPCAHVFHAECLIPWFSRPRHTTCPTCRFNIDPENLTYVSARQRRQEQRRAGNDNEPSENNVEEGPNPALDTAAPTDTGERAPQPGEQRPVVDLGSGLASFIQMLNAQRQPQQQPNNAANSAAPSGTQPQVEGPPFAMPTPMPAGGPGNFFPAGAGQMHMLPMILNAEGFPRMHIPVPWRDPFRLPSGGDRTNVPNQAPDANTNTTPAATVNEPLSTNSGASAPQGQPPHLHTMVADVRISVDMVFDGRLRRGGNQDPTNNPLQPTGGSDTAPQDPTQEQVIDDDDHDFDAGLPELIPIEGAEAQAGQFTRLFDLLGANGGNPAQNTGSPATSDNPEQPTPQTQPGAGQPQPQHRDLRGLPFGGIHVAGTGHSLEEAFNRALSRLRRMGQQTQEGQNAQPAQGEADGVTGDEDAPSPLPPHADAQQQGGAQRPWQFMPIPILNFGTPMRAQPEGPKRPWAPPPPPGPTLRQRIEKRERDAELRCHDVSCGLGPSDEDPLGYDVGDLGKVHQLSITISKGPGDAQGVQRPVCEHRFHTVCLVSAERVALRGAEASMNETGEVEVSCPVCRGAGCVTKEQWDEGVRALQ